MLLPYLLLLPALCAADPSAQWDALLPIMHRVSATPTTATQPLPDALHRALQEMQQTQAPPPPPPCAAPWGCSRPPYAGHMQSPLPADVQRLLDATVRRSDGILEYFMIRRMQSHYWSTL